MSLKLVDNNGNTLIDYHPDNDQQWITGFNSNFKDIDADDLTAFFTIDFINRKDMYDCFTKLRDYITSKSKWSPSENNEY